MKPYPKNLFSSYAEFEGYFKCLKKIKLGDTVHFYCYASSFGEGVSPTPYRTDIVRKATVIGDSCDKWIFLGVKDQRQVCLPPKQNWYLPLYRKTTKDFDNYPYGWALNRFELIEMLVYKIEKNEERNGA